MNKCSDAMSSIGYLDKNYNVVPCTVEQLVQSQHLSTDFVVQTNINDVTVSTTFLGARHHPDNWFETALLFPDGSVTISMRYQTHQQAVNGHAALVDCMKNQGDDE